MKYNKISPNIITCDNFLPQQQIDFLYMDFLNNQKRFKISNWLNEDGSSSEQFYSSNCGGFDFWNYSWKEFHEDCPSISNIKNWFIHQGLVYFAERNNLQIFSWLKKKVLWDIHVVAYNHGGYYNWHTDEGKGNVFTFNLILNKGTNLEGGNLLFLDGNETIEIENKNNFMVVFPSFIPHAITPLYAKNKKNVSFAEQRFSVQYWIKLDRKEE
jgi:Rps23 Pro-64 3,4-dihydroxylase Tpa1-like proline 4-hydroxylase